MVMPKTERPQGRQPFRADHDELRKSVIRATFEKPLYEATIATEIGVYSPHGKRILKSLLRSMVHQGDLETWEGKYCYTKELGGYLMSIPG